MKPNHIILAFVAGTLVVAAVAFVVITMNTTLSTGQAVGAGAAFLLGWAGLAYAGSSALRGMLQRSSAMARLARLREQTYSRLFMSAKSRR